MCLEDFLESATHLRISELQHFLTWGDFELDLGQHINHHVPFEGLLPQRTHGLTDGRTDNVKTVYPLQTKFAGGGGGIIIHSKRYAPDTIILKTKSEVKVTVTQKWYI